jgi:hypothetical protein
MLPGLVRDVLMAEPRDLRVAANALAGTDAWLRTGDALRADVEAKIAMDSLPPPTSAPHLQLAFTLTVTHSRLHARKIADLEPPAADPEEAEADPPEAA